ncbi:MAG TPA: non-canonical purine NTP pyrophosphatase [Verrucomicrobiae bacterium]|nr:non-canonical purine NTP pyrophosphatase [Verrucomicrobiae bacterium]
MLTLVTTNPSKYKPFAADLERMRIEIGAPPKEIPELQCLGFADALAHKAEAMSQLFGRPVLVDDAGLVLDAYTPFPGPLTSVVLKTLGAEGLRRLVSEVSNRGTMQCHLGWWSKNKLRTWSGVVPGRLDFTRNPRNPRMLLSDLFVADAPCRPGTLPHRTLALAHLEQEIFELHLEAGEAAVEEPGCPTSSGQCPFCVELEATGQSIFGEMCHQRLDSRIVYQDDDFIVMPPIGQFMEGGLLLLARKHIRSFACLPPNLFARLERLVAVIREELEALYGISPLVFEHGPAPEKSKGVCCVDHAHFNIFPANVLIRPHLTQRMNLPITTLDELARLKNAEFGYLFVQENDGSRRVYDGQLAPTQLVRRIITSKLGIAERWHWREYPGIDELVATYRSLHGRIRL